MTIHNARELKNNGVFEMIENNTVFDDKIIFVFKSGMAIEQARIWVNKFVNWYNSEHKHSGIVFVSPSERHDRKAEKILANRKSVYEKAKLKNPERWSRNIRKWEFEKEVWLNPERSEKGEYDLDELTKSS